MKDDRIHIKGNKDGINLIISMEEFATFDEVIEALLKTLSIGKGFYRNSIVKLTSDFSHVTESEIAKLKDELFEKIHIRDCIFEDTNAKEDYIIPKREKVLVENNEEIEEENEENNGVDEGKTKFIRKTLRGGQFVNYPGNIVVIGDINNGAEVCATGNVIVIGAIKGRVKAGADGNRDAMVAAFCLKPEILQIADIITISPDDGDAPAYPEVATIKDGSIIVEPYMPNKYV